MKFNVSHCVEFQTIIIYATSIFARKPTIVQFVTDSEHLFLRIMLYCKLSLSNMQQQKPPKSLILSEEIFTNALSPPKLKLTVWSVLSSTMWDPHLLEDINELEKVSCKMGNI